MAVWIFFIIKGLRKKSEYDCSTILLNCLSQLASQCTGALCCTFTNNGAKQAHEKMFDITNHQENIDQNYNKLFLHICQNGYHQKEHK